MWINIINNTREGDLIYNGCFNLCMRDAIEIYIWDHTKFSMTYLLDLDFIIFKRLHNSEDKQMYFICG